MIWAWWLPCGSGGCLGRCGALVGGGLLSGYGLGKVDCSYRKCVGRTYEEDACVPCMATDEDDCGCGQVGRCGIAGRRRGERGGGASTVRRCHRISGGLSGGQASCVSIGRDLREA
ncbi:uncharacterized protein A4U43_C06F16390 [Asparagus officinalis]|uniref:Uncharacterized protein n=1 Tax=Asparagus officinalis TaxID=4686 RepID=A0A5P1EMB3_ASPOF|nr:uncharacterized protein A4U43_C06F16390 [Asparagus officinalis]